MNLKQAKAKLADLSRSTGIKHPKVLVSELCSVISFLLDEIDRIKTPPVSVLQVLPKDAEITRRPSVEPTRPDQPRRKFSPPTPELPPPKKRSGNAGDAE